MIASEHKETNMEDITPDMPEEDWLAELDAELTASVGSELDLLGEVHPAVPERPMPRTADDLSAELSELRPEWDDLSGPDLANAFNAEMLGPELASAVARVGEGWRNLTALPSELDDGTPIVVMVAPAPDWDPTDPLGTGLDDLGRVKVLPIAAVMSDSLAKRLRRDRTHFVTADELGGLRP